jgi:hypothetical protein
LEHKDEVENKMVTERKLDKSRTKTRSTSKDIFNSRHTKIKATDRDKQGADKSEKANLKSEKS